MFAVIRTGGKQYRVAPNDVIVVERLAGEAGSNVELGEVLMLGDGGTEAQIGTPLVDKAAVFAEVLSRRAPPRSMSSRRSGARNTAAPAVTART